jgi:hypothetical protein
MQRDISSSSADSHTSKNKNKKTYALIRFICHYSYHLPSHGIPLTAPLPQPRRPHRHLIPRKLHNGRMPCIRNANHKPVPVGREPYPSNLSKEVHRLLCRVSSHTAVEGYIVCWFSYCQIGAVGGKPERSDGADVGREHRERGIGAAKVPHSGGEVLIAGGDDMAVGVPGGCE